MRAKRLKFLVARAAASVFTSSMTRVRGPTPPGDRRDAGRDSGSAAAKSTSPTSPSSDAVDADVDHHRAGLTMSPVTNFGLPMATTRMSACRVTAAQVARAAVAERHRRVGAGAASGQHASPAACRRCRCGRRRPTAGRRSAMSLRTSICCTPCRRAGQEPRAALDAGSPTFSGWKPSTSLSRADRFEHGRLVDLLRQRQLHEDAVDRVVAVQLGDERRAARSCDVVAGSRWSWLCMPTSSQARRLLRT